MANDLPYHSLTALAQMLAPAPTVPEFFTILGDVTQGGFDAEFDLVQG